MNKAAVFGAPRGQPVRMSAKRRGGAELARSPYTCMMTAAFSPDAALLEPFSDADADDAAGSESDGGGAARQTRSNSVLSTAEAAAAIIDGRWWDPRLGWDTLIAWHALWLSEDAAAATDRVISPIERVALTPTPSTSPTLLSSSASGSSLSSLGSVDSPAPSRAALEARSMALLPPFLVLPPPVAASPPRGRKRGSAIERPSRAPWRRCRALSCPPVPSPRARSTDDNKRPLFCAASDAIGEHVDRGTTTAM